MGAEERLGVTAGAMRSSQPWWHVDSVDYVVSVV